jgi:SAM-dependent methyltransferase
VSKTDTEILTKLIAGGEKMTDANKFDDYFSHLQRISLLGYLYKRFYSSLILFLISLRFGRNIVEVGSGTGSGILGAFPKYVQGLEINPVAVEFCKVKGLNAQIINADGTFPIFDSTFDACVLDNVLEHIEEPQQTLDECYRITKKDGGLIIVVPGMRGFESDSDHKKFYDADELRSLDSRWQLLNLFSMPFIFKSEKLSNGVKQYCLVASYRKI